MTLGTWTQVQNNTCMAGKYQIGLRQNVNIEQCRSFCEITTACLSVTYLPVKKYCYLNNADSNTTQVYTTVNCMGSQYTEYANTEPVKSKLAIYIYIFINKYLVYEFINFDANLVRIMITAFKWCHEKN